MTAALLVDPASVSTPPAHLLVPAQRAGSLLEVVEDFAERGGRELDPEQRLAIDVLTSVTDDGLWAAPTGVIVEPRQNGKSTGVLAPIVLSELYDLDVPDRIVWTAHRFKTSRDAFLDIRRLIAADPDLQARVVKVSDAHGEEAIHVDCGHGRTSSLEFIARSRMQGRGLGGKCVVLDEAFALSAGMLGALLPTLSARPNPLVLLGSSSCMADSVELWDVVQKLRAGDDPGLAGVEWCAAGSFREPGCAVDGCLHLVGTEGCALDDVDRWRAANPAMRYGRLTERFIVLVERVRMTPTEFGRERLGWHEEPKDPAAAPITKAMWDAREDAASSPAPDAPIALAVEVPPGRMLASISVAARREDGSVHGGLIDRRHGLAWVVDRVCEVAFAEGTEMAQLNRGTDDNPRFVPAVVIDPTSPAVTLVKQLQDRGLDVVLMTTREVGEATALLEDALTEGTLWHRASPDVDVALEGAAKRDLGDGLWAFGRRKSAGGSVHVDPIVGICNAHWAIRHAAEFSGPAFAFSS